MGSHLMSTLGYENKIYFWELQTKKTGTGPGRAEAFVRLPQRNGRLGKGHPGSSQMPLGGRGGGWGVPLIRVGLSRARRSLGGWGARVSGSSIGSGGLGKAA